MSIPKLVGVLNLTPDSFSDGGSYVDAETMRQAVALMVGNGANIIDIGAESTRPGATALSADEEWSRVEIFMQDVLPHFPHTVFSLDTRHARTARRTLPYGISWINDVSGFANEEMIDSVKESDCKLVVMHSLTVPADPAILLPENEDCIETLRQWFLNKMNTLQGYGITPERIICDPGIGFGKSAAQSLRIIRHIARLRQVTPQLLVGHSRKSFLKGLACGESVDIPTVAASFFLAQQGVDYLRVHNIPAHSAALRVLEALGDAS